MANQYPGAIWRPIDYSSHKACDELTALTVHEAVTTAEQSVFGWVSTEGSCNVFNGKHGYMEQYIPAGIESYANSDGNHRSFAMESYDGLQIVNDPSYHEVGSGGIYGDSAQTGRWDAGQCERISDLFAWLNIEHGIPLRLMASSYRSEHGIGPHRLGVPGWPGGYDELGGELWTSHPGKPCPGDLRIAQLPAIVARAQVIAAAVGSGRCSWLPTGEVDLPSSLSRTGNAPTPPTPPPPVKDWFDMATQADLTAAINAATAPLTAQVTVLTAQINQIAKVAASAVAAANSAAANGSPTAAVLFKNYNGGIGIADLAAGTWRGVGSPAQLGALARVPRYKNLQQLSAAQVLEIFGKQV